MPNILYIPAWYPSSFFKEQMDLVSTDYTYKILTGNRLSIGKRTAFRSFIKGEFNNFHLNEMDEYATVNYKWINHLPYKLEQKQIHYLKNKIGDVICYLFNGKRPDLIHIQALSDTAVFVSMWAKENHVPVILTEHVLFIRHELDSFSKLREKVYETVDKVMCVSNYLYRNLLTNGFVLNNAQVIGNLVNDNYVSNGLDRINKNGKILFVATHIQDKDIDTLLEVAQLLKSQETSLVIDVIGLDGNEKFSEERSLTEEIIYRQVNENLILKGKMSHDSLLKLYSQYMMLLSTSISETFGLSIAEAILNHLPVVITDSGGPWDFIYNQNSVVPVRDANAIVETVINTLKGMYDTDYIFQSKNIMEKYGRKSFQNLMINIYSEYL